MRRSYCIQPSSCFSKVLISSCDRGGVPPSQDLHCLLVRSQMSPMMSSLKLVKGLVEISAEIIFLLFGQGHAYRAATDVHTVHHFLRVIYDAIGPRKYGATVAANLADVATVALIIVEQLLSILRVAIWKRCGH